MLVVLKVLPYSEEEMVRYARSHHSEDTISYDVLDISKAEPGPRTRFPRGFHKEPSRIMIITRSQYDKCKPFHYVCNIQKLLHAF